MKARAYFEIRGKVAASMDEVESSAALMQWKANQRHMAHFARVAFMFGFLAQRHAQRRMGGKP